MRNPFGTTGWVVRHDRLPAVFRGTCFGFRHPHFLLTAAHCVAGIPREELSIGMVFDERPERGLSIEDLIIHPAADVAIVRITDALPIFDFFHEVETSFTWGNEVTAFGYPEDAAPDGPAPTPRYFRGHIQRLWHHESSLGFRYHAVELSFGAPGGLSGGPIALAHNPARVLGVVAENVRSSTYLESIVDIQDGAATYKEQIHNVINYGVAVRLDRIADWLDTHIPTPEL